MSVGECIWLSGLVAATLYGVYTIATKEQKLLNICSSMLAKEEHEPRFTKKELVDFAELEKDMDGYIGKLSNGELGKIGAIRNDKLEVVMMPIDKYEQMVELYMMIEKSQCT